LKPINQNSDENLLAAYRSGQETAFTQLVKRYEKELYNYLLRYLGQPALAEDVFQETFLQVSLSADSFDPKRRFRPWLYTIATNKARDLLRSRLRKHTVQLDDTNEDMSTADIWGNLLRDENRPVDILEKKQEVQQVQKIIGEMPQNLREILILAYYNQFSYKEMAEMLDVPLGTVKSRLHAAVAVFARQYQQEDKER